MLRRTLLHGGLATGLTQVTVGCREPVRPAIERAFVGQDPAVGHRVRDAVARGRTPKGWQTADVVIIGSGVAGASAAWRLHRAGVHNVVVLELEAAAGGTARGGTMPRSRYPMGAHYLPLPPPECTELRGLLGDVGLIVDRDDRGNLEVDPRYVAQAPVERHRQRGRWDEGLYPFAGQSSAEEAQWDRWQDHLLALARARDADGRRLFALPVQASSAALRHLDRISMAAYLDQHGFTSWRLRWCVDYACRDDYGCRLEDTSAFAGLHHFLARGGDEDVERPLLTWPQGNSFLVDAMLARAELGDRHLLQTAAVAIDPGAGRVTALDLATDAILGFEAPVVLWAAPRFVLPFVLPPGADPLAPQARSYAPWLVASVELDALPGGHGAPLAWDNVAIEADHLGYVVATHNEPLTETRKSTVITFYEPLTGDPIAARRRLQGGSLEHWSAHVERALGSMHAGLPAQMRRIHIARWGHGMLRPTPGTLFGPTAELAARPIGRVWPCAADVGGLPLFEQAFAEGIRAADQALAVHGRSVRG